MGFGDYLHWTAVVRDMYKYINSGSINERLDKINKLKNNYLKKFNKYGVQEYKHEDDEKDFKFFIFVANANCPLFKHKEGKEIFYNNPYVIKSPAKYPIVLRYPPIVLRGAYRPAKGPNVGKPPGALLHKWCGGFTV